jgi:hypothetical protein
MQLQLTCFPYGLFVDVRHVDGQRQLARRETFVGVATVLEVFSNDVKCVAVTLKFGGAAIIVFTL